MKIKRNRIRVLLLGGLGNQLFGFFFAQALNQKLPGRVEVSDQLIPFGSNASRSFVVDQLSELKVQPIKSIRGLLGKSRWLSNLDFVRRIFWQLYRFNSFKRRMNLEDFWKVRKFPRYGIEILDYFDNWFFPEYVAKNSGTSILGDFKSFYPRSPSNVETLEIVCHVRLGDYLKFPDTYKTLGENYYLSAIDLIRRENSAVKISVIVVSESSAEVREFYPKLASVSQRIVQREDLSSDLDAFRVMMKAEFLIAANSTFSMWAAWLGLTRRSITIVPLDSKQKIASNGTMELPWIVLDAQTGEILEKRPYSSWYQEHERKFNEVTSSIST